MDCSTNYLISREFPIETFNLVISFSPLSSQNLLAQTCKEFNNRINLIKEDYFHKIIQLDLKKGNEVDYQFLNLYFKEIKYLNILSQAEMPSSRSKTFAKISLLSGFEWNIILELYENIDIIEELDFSHCIVEELMPKDDPDPRWIHGLFEGKNIKKITLPADFLPYCPQVDLAGTAALLPPMIHLDTPIVLVGKKNLFRKIIERFFR